MRPSASGRDVATTRGDPPRSPSLMDDLRGSMLVESAMALRAVFAAVDSGEVNTTGWAFSACDRSSCSNRSNPPRPRGRRNGWRLLWGTSFEGPPLQMMAWAMAPIGGGRGFRTAAILLKRLLACNVMERRTRTTVGTV